MGRLCWLLFLVAGALSCGKNEGEQAVIRYGMKDATPETGQQNDGAPSDGPVRDADGTCSFEMDAADTESVRGTRIGFAGAMSLSAGRYEVQYIDGCMKYVGGDFGWTVNGTLDGTASWHLVGADTTAMTPYVILPGTVGYSPNDGAFANFEDCVTANIALAPITIEHEGGALGVWLVDLNYDDNVPGEGGRNPRWRLRALDCPGNAG